MPAGDDWLSPGEAATQAGLHREARRQGWRLRRWAAKEALAAALGSDAGPPRELEIANRENGAPVARRRGVPLPGCLSLTDRAGRAVCALAPPGLVVGCDLELVEPRSAAFVADWLTPAEQRLVRVAPDPALAANLVWSAKESALKVLGEGLRRPTRSVEVALDPPGDGGGSIWRPLRIGLAEGGELTGWWRRLDGFVLTVATGTPAGPPTRLGTHRSAGATAPVSAVSRPR